MAKKKKVSKPSKDYPLFAHATGQWCKKINAKQVYFGVLADPDAARERYDNFRKGKGKFTDAEIAANLAPGSITLEDGVNDFLNAKLKLVENNELTRRSLMDYTSSCERILRVLGHDTDATSVEVNQLEVLREDIAKTRGFVAMTTELQRCKTFFKWLFDSERIKVPIRTAVALKAPSKKNLRVERNSKPARMFSAVEIRRMLAIASVPLRAMILLGINAGLGNTDCSELVEDSIDFKAGYLDYHRSKTGAKRRCPLWPETLAAVRLAIEKRPTVVNPNAVGKVFVTRWGSLFVRLQPNGTTYIDSIVLEFGKLMRVSKVKPPGERKGLSFYGLRHTFETVASNTRDQVAIDLVMGHSEDSSDMSAVYREEISDERLETVVNHVRLWLWPAGDETKQIEIDKAAAESGAGDQPEGELAATAIEKKPKPRKKRTAKS